MLYEKNTHIFGLPERAHVTRVAFVGVRERGDAIRRLFIIGRMPFFSSRCTHSPSFVGRVFGAYWGLEKNDFSPSSAFLRVALTARTHTAGPRISILYIYEEGEGKLLFYVFSYGGRNGQARRVKRNAVLCVHLYMHTVTYMERAGLFCGANRLVAFE